MLNEIIEDTKKGMEKLVKHGYPTINVQIDSFISQNSDEIIVYGVNPGSFVRQSNSFDDSAYRTTIQILSV